MSGTLGLPLDSPTKTPTASLGKQKENEMNSEQEKALTNIIEMATDDDHLLVPFSLDQLKMANVVIAKMKTKLNMIADLIHVAFESG